MKTSKYNVIFDCNNKKYIFNTLNCALAEINDEMASMLSKTKNLDFRGKEKIEKQMQDTGFIINDEVDELAILKYRYYKGKNSNVVTITVAPTLQCNFECPYCYENAENNFIKDEVKNAIYKKIENLLKHGKKISINWFGGEPLLAKGIVKEMSEKINLLCKKYDTECVFDMSTNGFLLDRPTVSQLLNLGISSVQITIDGTPEIHNKRRKLKGSNADTFNKIIENIKNGIGIGMNFRIRINADKTNIFCLEDLLKILVKEGLQNTFVNIVCVRNYTKLETKNTLTTEEAGEITIKFSKLLKKYGFKHYDDLCYPFSIAKGGCSAECEDNVIVDPNGYLYKCIVETGDVKNSYGNILNFSEKDNESINNLKYLMNNPFEKSECLNCKVLPLCLGGCVYYTLKYKNKSDCSIWKYNLKNKLSEICKIIKD